MNATCRNKIRVQFAYIYVYLPALCLAAPSGGRSGQRAQIFAFKCEEAVVSVARILLLELCFCYPQNLKCEIGVWLTVHRSSMWNKKPTRCHLVLYLFLLYELFFICCSTCFRPPCAHPQELTTYWYFFRVWCSAVAV